MDSFHKSYDLYLDELAKTYISEDEIIEILKSDSTHYDEFMRQIDFELGIVRELRPEVITGFKYLNTLTKP